MKIFASVLLFFLLASREVVLAAEEDGHNHVDHDHGHGHKCACEAIEFGFEINCDDTAKMLTSLSDLQSGGCATDCSSDACVENWHIVQAHHDYCPENGLPEVRFDRTASTREQARKTSACRHRILAYHS